MKGEKSNHIETIKSLLVTVQASQRIHAIIIEGPAGWGKTTAVDEALRTAGVQGVHLGAYSTPLNLYNFLYANRQAVVIIDDCAGLFSDQCSMSILKAATWGQGGGRVIRWGSTSSKAACDNFIFHGKLVVVCNSFPATPDAIAVRSRSFPCRIDVTLARAKELLSEAARDAKWYPNTKTARQVAEFLIKQLNTKSINQMSYRTLQMGYELAQYNSKTWTNLLEQMISVGPEDPKKLILHLAKQELKVKEQVRIFEETTGLKRRTFFKYRSEIQRKSSMR